MSTGVVSTPVLLIHQIRCLSGLRLQLPNPLYYIILFVFVFFLLLKSLEFPAHSNPLAQY